ncbi:sulfite exporter TauE/SafE family protein [Aliidiomarina maris]|uniref:Sulfite exporter TauE/SafE family protein n=1 Tax=Aliidiomarina maris TaxID=531312 RepID=A0A327X0V5_9GAMM|nr:sulfite exporter TauE/SafE family protein [Aliidiomarina maris]MCL5051501.1 sulfite exporter TauE/SafE family protein [Bacillota bacterium]RAJ98914.1 hypothetical protein B0I24_104116 [Aliidiomarina maris]RUO25057.1 sulfite exporter TauE/SafE family protein [Aliidiomarina maris]
MHNLDWLAALVMGLAGSGHCLAMCGGLAGAMGYSQNGWRLLMYNLGRLTSYTIAGGIVGAAVLATTTIHQDGLIWLRLVAGIMMVLLGLYITRVWMVLTFLERIGAILWRRLQPLTRHFPPNASTHKLFIAGMLWGWLPCGLVYSALAWAALSGSPLSGAATMLAFGVGTLPSMLILGLFSRKLSQFVRTSGFRWVAGILMIGYGIVTAAIAVQQL